MLPIVFATGANKDVPETYKRYHNFDYIKKPFAAEEFRRISRRFLDEIQSQTETGRMDREKAVRVDDGGRATIVKAKDILYAKKEKRQTVLVLAGQEYRLSDMALGDFVAYVNEWMFVLCNRSCAVNVSNIHEIRPRTYKRA
jgi:DNA-binding LytR/AlgR family response regulator